MGIKEYRATGGNRALLNDYHRKSDSLAQWQINFLPDTATQIYGFDYLGSGYHGIFSGSEYYPYLSGNYDLRFKSVECGKTDKVIVDFGSYPERDSVVFKDKWGVKLKVSKGNILNFSGVTDADTNYIYAYRGDEKIGKLSVNTYKKKSYKVVLVRVNKATLPDINELEKYLGKVYRQSVDTIEIATDTLTVNGLDKFSHGGSGVLTVYNDDQKTVLRAYDSEMKNGVYYLFFIDNVTDKKDGNGTMVSGYMPRGYNAGFIYDKGSPHTIAHELGHGIAGLEHVFENSKSSGKTKNLMDYSSGEELWHFQWDAIQDPSRVWMKWSKDESEGEWFNAKVITDAIAKSYTINYEGSLTFLTPAGYPIILPSTLTQVSFVSLIDECPDGALTKFNIGKDSYVAHYLVNEKGDKIKFIGYHSPLNDKYYENDYDANKPENVILGYNYDCHIELLSIDYNKILPVFAKIKKLGDGEVKLSNIPYVLMGMNHLVTISDTEACFLKTDLAKAFYANEVSKIALHEKETIYNSKIHRISAEIDNFLLENPNAVLQLESFIDDILTKYKYLEYEWSVNDCSKLRKYLEYFVNSYTHKESLLLSSSIEDNKVIGLFGFNQSLDQILSEYSNSTKVEIICYLLKISCLTKNDNISSILNNVKKDDYAKFIDIIYTEDDDIINSNIWDSRCLFDLVLAKNGSCNLIFANFSKLMWDILEKNKGNKSFEIFQQFNDYTPYSSMTSFFDSHGFTLFMSIDARKKLLKYYSEYGLSDEDENVVIRIIKNTPDEDLDVLLTYMKEYKLYSTFASKIDNIGGAANYDSYYRIVKEKWSKCYPDKGDDEFIKDTDQAFLSWYAKDRHCSLFHYTISLGAKIAAYIGGFNGSVSYGIGVDGYKNIALLGNANVFGYFLEKGFRYDKLTDIVDKSFDDAISDFKNDDDFIVGIGPMVGASLNFDFFAPDVRSLYGIGYTSSFSGSLRGVDLSILFNYDNEKKFIGFGFGIGASIDYLNLPISFETITETNRGLIINIEEITQIRFEDFDTSQKSKPSYDIENGKLVIRSLFGTLKTNLDAKFDDIKLKNYIITQKANKKYNN